MTVPELQLATHDPHYETEGTPRWQDDAACKGQPTSVFFPPRGDFTLHRIAVAFCDACPVKAQCLDEHLEEDDGIFGGMGGTERRKERTRRVRAGLRARRRPIPTSKCGTTAGYDRHRRQGEEACQACREARNAYNRRYKQDLRARRALAEAVDV